MANYVWQATNAPKQTRHDDIWFIDAATGWAVNSAGQILTTNNFGENWVEQVQTGPNSYLRCIAFANPNIGWVGSTTRKSRLWHTSNGGRSWAKVPNLPPQPTAICGLWVVDPETIYASGTNYPNRPTAVIKTIDGGKTWTSFSMDQHASLLVDIFFLDALRGWVVGGRGGQSRAQVKPVVMYTDDGGKSWRNQLEGMEDDFPNGEWGWKIHFIDELVGFVSLENFDEGAILKTVDGGGTWIRLPINDPQGNANLEGIGFINETTGWVGGWGDRDFKGGYSSKTENGGINWSDANHIGRFINRFRFTGNSDVVAYASGDTIYRYAKADFSLPAKFEHLGTSEAFRQPSILSDDASEFTDHFSISVNIPVGARRLTVEIWDRFAGHIVEIVDEYNPSPGLFRVKWNFLNTEGLDVGDGHFIYRVTIDNLAESRIIRRNRSGTKK